MGEEHLPRPTYSQLVEELAVQAPLVVIQEHLFNDLVEELGSTRAVGEWLVGLAERVGHPVALHMEGMTTLLGPLGWGQERLDGWAAGHWEALEQAFGTAREVLHPADVLGKDDEG